MKKSDVLERMTVQDTPTFEQRPLTPTCAACMHKIDLMEEAVMALSGQWFPNRELKEPVFVLEADVPLEVTALPNEQLALMSPGGSRSLDVVRHIHTDCLNRMLAEAHGELDYYLLDQDEYDDGDYR